MAKAKNLQNKAAAQAAKEASASAANEAQKAANWAVGANEKAAARQAEAAAKADEALRKRREKEALLAEEEANAGPGGKFKKTPVLSKKGKNNKGKNDLSLLEDALVSGAEKKQKTQKEAERKKHERLKAEELMLKEQKAAAEASKDPLLTVTEDLIRGTTDDLVGRAANKALDEEYIASGIDSALQGLGISADGAKGPSNKALYKAFEERMMPVMKDDFPGLKLSQYKDKIFQAWKKSPENPANQQPK